MVFFFIVSCIVWCDNHGVSLAGMADFGLLSLLVFSSYGEVDRR